MDTARIPRDPARHRTLVIIGPIGPGYALTRRSLGRVLLIVPPFAIIS